MYKNIILKLSGEALGNSDSNLSPDKLASLAQEIATLNSKGIKIGIVVGGGNHIRGRDLSLIGMDRSSADYMGMLGTVMNAIALQAILKNKGCKALVMSALDIEGVMSFNQDLALKKLAEGYVLIFGGGIGNPYFSTDSTAALRACQLNSEIILIAKNGVDGVYDCDPDINSSASRFDLISFSDILIKDLKVIDSTAASLCRDNHIKAFLFDMNVAGNITKAAKGEAIGTLISEE